MKRNFFLRDFAAQVADKCFYLGAPVLVVLAAATSASAQAPACPPPYYTPACPPGAVPGYSPAAQEAAPQHATPAAPQTGTPVAPGAAIEEAPATGAASVVDQPQGTGVMQQTDAGVQPDIGAQSGASIDGGGAGADINAGGVDTGGVDTGGVDTGGVDAVGSGVSANVDSFMGGDGDASSFSGEAPAAFAGGAAGVQGGSGAAMSDVAGYIDPATIRNRVRFRFDSARGANFIDRAEYMYPRLPGVALNNATGYNLQEYRLYFEQVILHKTSLFIEGAVRNLEGFPTGTQRGYGDMTAGFRYALIDSPEQVLTFQFRTYIPTGNSSQGLGTGHVSIEPGLIYLQRLTSRLSIFSEVHDWQAFGGTRLNAAGTQRFSGNVLRAGVGTSYDFWQGCCMGKPAAFTGVAEIVGWTVLDGFKTDGLATPNVAADDVILDADGDTIVNGKYGVRYTAGEHSMYVGYGHNWSSQRWYTDLLRVEYTMTY